MYMCEIVETTKRNRAIERVLCHEHRAVGF